MKKILLTAVLALSLVFLAACNGGNQAAENIYDHLETSVELEEEFHEAQSELVEIEQQEYELYNEMIEVNMDELDEIEGTVNEALDLLDERRQLMEQEMDSIDAAKVEFDQVEQYVEDLDEEAQPAANDMIEKMDERYEAFVSLYDAYMQSLDYDEELYEMLLDEELESETLDEQVDLVNNSYDEITEAQETFNQRTSEFNDLKRDFYEAVELEVEFVE
ncbi:prefoldin subunit 5 [Alkalibacillus filiformis]|uniref:Prefoldin subunit 5 n=1 Tax=Alkalibacillus filiformis TaxID=200990 RepID=A0ABU0DQ12_9BACI|nr:YkyA family protein [Alkalibacillus filiformis]MDQ0350450.1 prefoldin subunit 5 [Alkalibacillus filiformis]